MKTMASWTALYDVRLGNGSSQWQS